VIAVVINFRSLDTEIDVKIQSLGCVCIDEAGISR